MVLSVKRFASTCCFLAFQAVLFTLFVPSAFATDDIRSGKIITTDADTLHGEILMADTYSLSWRVQFREEGESSFRNFRAFDIFAYYIEDEAAYYSVQGDFDVEGLQTVFMREESSGTVKLYSSRITRDHTAFFARNREGRLIYLRQEFYIDQLKSVFRECARFLQRERHPQRTYRYNEEGMIRAFAEYYKCEGDPVSHLESRLIPQERTTRFGIIGGLNSSNSRITDDNNLYQDVPFDYVTGFTIGAFVDFPLTERLFLQPEIFYTTRGGTTSVRFFQPPGVDYTIVSDDEITMTFNYVGVNIPIRREWELAGFRPFISGGPVIGYLVKREAFMQREVINEDDEFETQEGEIIGLYKNLSFGINAAVGMRVPFGTYSFFVTSRYSRLFSNLDSQTDSFRTTSLEFVTGFSF